MTSARRKRKGHAFFRDTIVGGVLLRCQCGWRAWPKINWPEPGWDDQPIPNEHDQWIDYHAHLTTPPDGN